MKTTMKEKGNDQKKYANNPDKLKETSKRLMLMTQKSLKKLPKKLTLMTHISFKKLPTRLEAFYYVCY